MLVSLLKPGNERNQVLVWKSSFFILLAMVGANILDVIENFVRAQPMSQNPFIQLEVAAIVYFVVLMFYKKGMVVDMENTIRNRRKELGLSQEELARKCGVSRQTVNAIENNKYDPTLALAFSLAKELCVTVDELFIPS
jgi:putative transcriptional regulator